MSSSLSLELTLLVEVVPPESLSLEGFDAFVDNVLNPSIDESSIESSEIPLRMEDWTIQNHSTEDGTYEFEIVISLETEDTECMKNEHKHATMVYLHSICNNFIRFENTEVSYAMRPTHVTYYSSEDSGEDEEEMMIESFRDHDLE